VLATPTVAGDLVFIGSCAGVFYALDREDGTPVWTYDIRKDRSAEFHGDPLVSDHFVFVGTDGEAGYVYAFDRATGKVRWKSPADEAAGGSRGFPTDILRAGPRLYTVALGDSVVALDRRDGRTNWKFSSPASLERRRFSNTAAIAAGRVFFAGLDGILYALDAWTGKVVWKRAIGAPFSTAVVPVQRDLIVGAADKRLYRIRQSDGSVVASLELPHRPAYTPVLSGDELLVVSERELFAVRSSLSEISWSRSAAKEWSTPRPRLWKGAVIAGDGPDLYALDPRSGRELWKHRLGGTIRGIGSDEHVLYVGTLGGDIYAFRPASGAPPAQHRH
jgi:outer membrane protein assembly factor BamB